MTAARTGSAMARKAHSWRRLTRGMLAGAVRLGTATKVLSGRRPVRAWAASARGGLREAHGAGALVVDLLDRLDHQLDTEPLVDEVVAGPSEPLGQAGVEEEARDRGREGDRVVVLDEQAGDAVLDHLGDPADVRRDDRPRQRHRFEDRQALRLAPRR